MTCSCIRRALKYSKSHHLLGWRACACDIHQALSSARPPRKRAWVWGLALVGVPVRPIYIYIYIFITYLPLLTVHFSMTRTVRYQPILHTLYYTLRTEHAYCLSYRFLNNVVITTVIEMVEIIEILDGWLGQHSVERVRYVINNLLHLVIVKYGDISLVPCIFTRLWLVTILSLLVKYLFIFHADPCNNSYIYFFKQPWN